MIISELIELFKTLANRDFDMSKINLSRRNIKSISSFSSNSIFYFPVIVSDQCQLDEVTMISRALEKQYASFVVACISLMPFQRVSSSNVWAVDDYLKNFHQNIGIAPGADSFSRDFTSLSGLAEAVGSMKSGDVIVPPYATSVGNFFLKVYNESVAKNTDFVTYLTENYISMNDIFNEDALDPYTKALAERYKRVNEELETWGFIGYEPPENLLNNGLDETVDYYNPFIPEILDEGSNPVDKIKYTLESITDNKIKSCKNKTKLRSMESKLKGLKNKYTSYLKRYKKRYKENEQNGTKKKLVIRFNKSSIPNPKTFMQEFGSYMKVINRKLKLCEKRRNELSKGPNKTVSIKESVEEDILYSEYLQESALTAKDRKNIPDEHFGLPSQRKFPLNDSKHVKYAIQMSGHVKDKKELKTLAENIARRAQELDMDITVSKKNALHEYMPEAMRETAYQEDPLTDLTSLDEEALDMLIEAVDQDMKYLEEDADQLLTEEVDPDTLRRTQEAHRNGIVAGMNRSAETIKDERRKNERLSKELERVTKENEQLLKDKEVGATKKSSSYKSVSIGTENPGNTIDMSKRNRQSADGDYSHRTFDREVFTKMDMEKANEMVPTFTKANIGFIVDGTEQVETREILIGVKTYVHRVQTSLLVNELYQTVIQKRKFLKFVKFITGEEKSLSDLLFGIKELKHDAFNTRSSATKWNAAFKNRKRLAKLSVPFIMRSYLPNGTIVMTMNEVEYVKDNFGIDLIEGSHAKMIMDQNFLLGFVILDQSNEIAYVMYDGINQGQFQQYSYTALDREQKNTDKQMRDLFRLMNR